MAPRADLAEVRAWLAEIFVEVRILGETDVALHADFEEHAAGLLGLER